MFFDLRASYVRKGCDGGKFKMTNEKYRTTCKIKNGQQYPEEKKL